MKKSLIALSTIAALTLGTASTFAAPVAPAKKSAPNTTVTAPVATVKKEAPKPSVAPAKKEAPKAIKKAPQPKKKTR